MNASDPAAGDGNTHPAIERAFELGGDPERIASYYDEWAATYDADVAGELYGLPASTVAVLRGALDRGPDAPDAEVLDGGCGTGLIGVALAAAGFATIDGVDLSPGMVAAARRRGVYRRLLAPVDLTAEPPDGWGRAYDAMVVGGVFTLGHLPAATLALMPRWVRPGGVLVTSVRDSYYDTAGYQAASDALVEIGALTELVHAVDLPYTVDSTGHYFAYAVA